jgi:hypothetical protein
MKNFPLTHGENGATPSLFPVTPTLAHGLSPSRKSIRKNDSERLADTVAAEVENKPNQLNPPRRARLVFDEESDVAPPEGFSNRETWMAAAWLNSLAQGGACVQGRLVDLPAAESNEIRRWFHHRWQEVKRDEAPQWVREGFVSIGSLWKVRWNEVAAHYRRCPWADVIQEAFANARLLGMPVDRSRETVTRRRNAIARYIGRPLASCRELSATEWRAVADAIQMGELWW